MTSVMTQITGDSFDDAFEDLKEAIAETKRQASAYVLSTFPDRDTLNTIAVMVRRALQTSLIQVNAIYNGHQITIGGSPHVDMPVSVKEANTLCVMTAARGVPLAVNDMQHNPVADQVHDSSYMAWASAPIFINGESAGSMCALELKQTRVWTLDDQHKLELAAQQVTDAVSEWIAAG